MYCVLCTVYCVLCTVYCVLCTVYCVFLQRPVQKFHGRCFFLTAVKCLYIRKALFFHGRFFLFFTATTAVGRAFFFHFRDVRFTCMFCPKNFFSTSKTEITEIGGPNFTLLFSHTPFLVFLYHFTLAKIRKIRKKKIFFSGKFRPLRCVWGHRKMQKNAKIGCFEHLWLHHIHVSEQAYTIAENGSGRR